MATIAHFPRPVPPHRASSGLSPSINLSSTSIPLDTITVVPIPNKHIPVCPHGPVPVVPDEPAAAIVTPPSTPESHPQSLLYPPDTFPRLAPTDGSDDYVYQLGTTDVATALDYVARQPLPDPSLVFPWYHGLHPSNHIQQAFFVQRRRALRSTPCCLRGVTLVKADGDPGVSRLKGAIIPQELLQSGCANPDFLEVDPREGFSIRNFQIQAAKAAMTSDIIVYGEDESLVRRLAQAIARAQRVWRQNHESRGHPLPEYNTFVCLAPFSEFETKHPEIVVVDSAGRLTGNVVDLFSQERKEMCEMAAASEISHNVWMGPTPEPGSEEERSFDILIECSDISRLNPTGLKELVGSTQVFSAPAFFEFPSSGSILPPTYSHAEADGIIESCVWIYHLAHGTRPPSSPCGRGQKDAELDTEYILVAEKEPVVPRRKILIHCQDGYTESTMLGIAYFSFSTGMPVPDAWLQLHTIKKRNFFAYPTDVALLTAIAPRLLTASPLCAGMSAEEITSLVSNEPRWLPGLDGSFPSRILEHMYLGNLGHANNPDLLRALGIGQILSVGENAMWREGELEEWGFDNVCIIQNVQDNGIDPLTSEIERCLEFIDRGKRNGTATLVHCRVGVSRSATVCIAEVMRTMHLSLPRAYSFVRARRLNVIIQPHLRFAYELLLRESEGASKRELEWGEFAREIALMNRPYAR